MEAKLPEENLTNNLENFEHTGGEYYGITENLQNQVFSGHFFELFSPRY